MTAKKQPEKSGTKMPKLQKGKGQKIVDDSEYMQFDRSLTVPPKEIKADLQKDIAAKMKKNGIAKPTQAQIDEVYYGAIVDRRAKASPAKVKAAQAACDKHAKIVGLTPDKIPAGIKPLKGVAKPASKATAKSPAKKGGCGKSCKK